MVLKNITRFLTPIRAWQKYFIFKHFYLKSLISNKSKNRTKQRTVLSLLTSRARYRLLGNAPSTSVYQISCESLRLWRRWKNFISKCWQACFRLWWRMNEHSCKFNVTLLTGKNLAKYLRLVLASISVSTRANWRLICFDILAEHVLQKRSLEWSTDRANISNYNYNRP